MSALQDLAQHDVDLLVSCLAERAIAEMQAGREQHAHRALDLAERLSGDAA